MPIILTHWGRVTHICDSKLIIIGSDNGLSPGRRHAIIWANAGILLIGPLGTNFGEIVIELYRFSFKKIHLKMSSGKWRPSCLGLNVLKHFDGCWFAGKVAHLDMTQIQKELCWIGNHDIRELIILDHIGAADSLVKLLIWHNGIEIALIIQPK